jgi:hypothetical protein
MIGNSKVVLPQFAPFAQANMASFLTDYFIPERNEQADERATTNLRQAGA